MWLQFIKIVFFVWITCTQLCAQSDDTPKSSWRNRSRSLGLIAGGFRGYDINGDGIGIKDSYLPLLCPGIYGSIGNEKKQYFFTAKYTQVSTATLTRFRFLFSGFQSVLLQYVREEGLLSVGRQRFIDYKNKSVAKLFFSNEIVYGYGRLKYNQLSINGDAFGTSIGYRYHSISFLQTMGVKFDFTKSNFRMLVESGFALEMLFNKRNYNKPAEHIPFIGVSTGFNFRVLQLTLVKVFRS